MFGLPNTFISMSQCDLEPRMSLGANKYRVAQNIYLTKRMKTITNALNVYLFKYF